MCLHVCALSQHTAAACVATASNIQERQKSECRPPQDIQVHKHRISQSCLTQCEMSTAVHVLVRYRHQGFPTPILTVHMNNQKRVMRLCTMIWSTYHALLLLACSTKPAIRRQQHLSQCTTAYTVLLAYKAALSSYKRINLYEQCSIDNFPVLRHFAAE